MADIPIEALTQQQIEKLSFYRDKWLEIELSCEPRNLKSAKNAALDLYAQQGFEKPKLFFQFESPLSTGMGVHLLYCHFDTFKNSVGDSIWDSIWDSIRVSVENSVWNSTSASVRASVWDAISDSIGDPIWDSVENSIWDAAENSVLNSTSASVRASVWDSIGDVISDSIGDANWDSTSDAIWDSVAHSIGNSVRMPSNSAWFGFYDYFQSVCGLDLSIINPVFEIAKHCGDWIPYENAVILEDRPKAIHWDDQNRPHHPNRHAIEYRDGWGVCMWHGTRVPDKWIFESEKHLNAEICLTHPNIEQRRAASEIYGWHRVLNEVTNRVIDTDSNPQIGELLSVDLPDVGELMFLRVQCGTGRTFALPVPPDMRTAREANAWTYGLEAEEYSPEIRT